MKTHIEGIGAGATIPLPSDESGNSLAFVRSMRISCPARRTAGGVSPPFRQGNDRLRCAFRRFRER